MQTLTLGNVFTDQTPVISMVSQLSVISMPPSSSNHYNEEAELR